MVDCFISYFENRLLILSVGVLRVYLCQFTPILILVTALYYQWYILRQAQSHSLYFLTASDVRAIRISTIIPSHLDIDKRWIFIFLQVLRNAGAVLELNLATLIDSGMSRHFIILLKLI